MAHFGTLVGVDLPQRHRLLGHFREMTLAARLQLLGSHGVAPLVVMFGPFARVLNS
jgi:hypothetical protein